MQLFLSLLFKLSPLYVMMGMGYYLGRRFENMSRPLSQIQIYLLIPVVTFTNLLKVSFSPDLFVLPVYRFALCLGLSAMVFGLAQRYVRGYAPLLAHASGASNVGYLGIPLAVALLPPELLPVYIFTMLGGTIYENTFGYYWMARGRHTPRESIKSLFGTPLPYAVMLGVVMNSFGFALPVSWQSIEQNCLGAYVVLGALIIGLGLARQETVKIERMTLSIICAMKFIIWPLVTVAFIYIMKFTPFTIPEAYEHVLLLMSVLPAAANTAVLAALFDIYHDEAASAVAVTTLFSVFVVPVCAAIFGFGHG